VGLQGYYNVPLDSYRAIMNHALDHGFRAIDTDWGDLGARERRRPA
jgi:hypothetical protein